MHTSNIFEKTNNSFKKQFNKVIIKRVLLMLMVLFPATFFAQTTTVSEQQLTQFVKVFQEIQLANNAFQIKMDGLLAEHQLTSEQFTKMYEAKYMKEGKDEFTAEEWERHGLVLKQLEMLQVEFQTTMNSIIENNGMTENDYQQIFVEIQQDKDLQEQFTTLMQQSAE